MSLLPNTEHQIPALSQHQRLQNVPGQVFVLYNLFQSIANECSVHVNELVFQVGRIVGYIFQQSFQNSMQPACAYVLAAAVHLGCDSWRVRQLSRP